MFSETSKLPVHTESENVLMWHVTQPIRAILMFNVDKEQNIGPISLNVGGAMLHDIKVC